MNKRNPAIIFILIAALIAGYFFISLYNSRQTEHQQRLKKESELAAKLMELSTKDAKISELEKQIANVQKEFDEKISLMETDLKTRDLANQELQARLDQSAKEKEALQGENALKQKNIETLTEKLKNFETDKSDLLNTIHQMKADLEAKKEKNPPAGNEPPHDSPEPLKSNAPTVSLGQIFVQKSSGTAVKIQQVDKLYGFVIISAGSKDGIRPDMTVDIVRGDKLVGKAVVKKVRPNLSAALVLPEPSYGEIQAGDLVSLS